MTRTDQSALGLAAVVVATMPYFAIVARGRPRDADVARRPTTLLLGYWIRDWVMWVIGPLDRALVRWRISPDVFNYLGAAFGLGSGIAYALGLLSVGGWLVLLGGAADIFDGRIARARGICSRYGDFLDSTLDRFAECFSFIGLAVYFARSPWAELTVIVALSGSLLVSYARARGEVLGVDFAGGLMQRAERLVLLALASLLDAPVTVRLGWRPGVLVIVVLALIGVASMGTACYRTVRVARTLRREDS